MQYQIKFYGLNWQTYNVPSSINQQLVAAQTPTAILQVIIDNAAELTKLHQQNRKGFHYCLLDPSGSETVAELMSDVLTNKGIEHNVRIAEDINEGHEVLHYVEVNNVDYYFPFEKEEELALEITFPVIPKRRKQC